MKLPITIISISATVLTIAAIEIGTIASEDVLEPSVRNEVDHALSREFDFAAYTGTVHHAAIPSAWTNALTPTAQAVKLISLQRADGRWLCGTNDVTKSAAAILRSL